MRCHATVHLLTLDVNWVDSIYAQPPSTSSRGGTRVSMHRANFDSAQRPECDSVREKLLERNKLELRFTEIKPTRLLAETVANVTESPSRDGLLIKVDVT